MNKTADTILDILFRRLNLKPTKDNQIIFRDAEQSLMNDILALVGEDELILEDSMGNPVTSHDVSRLKRNQLRAELRQKMRHYFGQDNQGGKT